MSDDRAIELFVRDGNPREDWPLVDEAMRLHYRLEAASIAKRMGMKFIGRLPGQGPWSMVRFNEITVCVSPNAPACIVRNGLIEPIVLGG